METEVEVQKPVEYLPKPAPNVAAPLPPEPTPVDRKPGSDGTSELKQAVAESSKILQNSKPQTPKIKRGRGRPRKDGAVPGASLQSQAPSVTPPAPQPPPDLSQHIKTPLIAISNIPAAKYRIPELALTPDEAQSCAEALQGVVNAFVPDVQAMSPKTAAIFGVIIVFGSVTLSKIQIYNLRIAELMAETHKQDQEIINSSSPSQGSVVAAQSYFSKSPTAPL